MLSGRRRLLGSSENGQVQQQALLHEGYVQWVLEASSYAQRVQEVFEDPKTRFRLRAGVCHQLDSSEIDVSPLVQSKLAKQGVVGGNRVF